MFKSSQGVILNTTELSPWEKMHVGKRYLRIALELAILALLYLLPYIGGRYEINSLGMYQDISPWRFVVYGKWPISNYAYKIYCFGMFFTPAVLYLVLIFLITGRKLLQEAEEALGLKKHKESGPRFHGYKN